MHLRPGRFAFRAAPFRKLSRKGGLPVVKETVEAAPISPGYRSLLPLGKGTNKAWVRLLIEQSDELNRVTIWVAKVKLRRRHPADNGWFYRLYPGKTVCGDTKVIEPLAASKQVWQRDGNRQMRRV
jgi:hypothetical protein